ncbi:MBL fold metallo-hydrolase [Lichenicola sp.]|uniref:MBL fold metallo-hydrolase n=1 Tax=Lichenicola sp. TaxID=2804529 RepID=UPI003B000109
MSRPRFPVSDHCDGEHFHNPAMAGDAGQPEPARGLMPILRWRFGGTRVRWPEHVTDPPPAGDPGTAPPPGGIALTFIGHSSFLLRLGGLTILTDPIFSQRCSPVQWLGPQRARPPGRRFEDLPRIDLVLVSHNHYDHLDLASLRAVVRRDDPAFITPLGNRHLLAKAGAASITELDWWQQHTLRDAVVTATPARHFSARTPFDRNAALWSGFMIEHQGLRVLFAGDSGDGPHWLEIHQRLGAPDLALLPIGAYDPRNLMAPVHMDPEEAAGAHRALQARRSVGIHFGTFQLTDEPIDEPPRRLAAALLAQGIDRDAFTTLGFGETREFGG